MAGSTVTLSGVLTPREHQQLLARLREAPALQKGRVRVVDHIEYPAAEDPPTGVEEQAESDLDKNSPTIETWAEVNVTSQPSTAIVYVEGKRHAGPTPTTVRLPPGQYSFALRKPGFHPYEGVVQLRAEERMQLDVQLTPLPPGEGQKRPLRP